MQHSAVMSTPLGMLVQTSADQEVEKICLFQEQKLYVRENQFHKRIFKWSWGRGRLDTETRQIARQRIQTLFNLAWETVHDDPALAQRYVDTARKIAMAAKIRLPTGYRRQVCKHCKGFMLPGVSCRVRLKQKREPHVVITCLRCGGLTRIPLVERREKLKK